MLGTLLSEPVENLSARERFASLLAHDGCLRPIYDQVLFEIDDCVVAPTLGSIVPNWLLVVPKQWHLNFATWNAANGIAPNHLIHKVLTKWNIAPERAIWFEHGPAQTGTSVACGVDHAHLHIIVDPPFSFESFAAVVQEQTAFQWRRVLPENCYGLLDFQSSYLISGSSTAVVISQNVETVGSQFFRRVIADLAGRSNEWNYRTHSHIENVKKTLMMFENNRMRFANL